MPQWSHGKGGSACNYCYMEDSSVHLYFTLGWKGGIQSVTRSDNQEPRPGPHSPTEAVEGCENANPSTPGPTISDRDTFF